MKAGVRPQARFHHRKAMFACRPGRRRWTLRRLRLQPSVIILGVGKVRTVRVLGVLGSIPRVIRAAWLLFDNVPGSLVVLDVLQRGKTELVPDLPLVGIGPLDGPLIHQELS